MNGIMIYPLMVDGSVLLLFWIAFVDCATVKLNGASGRCPVVEGVD